MFARYKKTPASAASPAQPAPAAAAAIAPAAAAPAPAAPRPATPAPTMPVVAARSPATVASLDKDRKRKERMAEIKLDMHGALLESLNLGALETASEADLKAEIGAITTEHLAERGIALTREERTALFQELYDEVRGLGPPSPHAGAPTMPVPTPSVSGSHLPTFLGFS